MSPVLYENAREDAGKGQPPKIHQQLSDRLEKAGGQIKRLENKCLVLDLCTCILIKTAFEQLDTENFYNPTKRFDFSRITINEGNHKELNEKERKELRDLGITFL